MNAPIIWIILPGIIAVFLFTLRRWRGVTNLLGIATALLLALLAWRLPIGEPVLLDLISGIPTFFVDDTLIVLGRRFIIPDGARPLLVLLFISVAFWFVGAVVSETDRMFVPLGLGMAASLTAAIAVEPFLYAAILIELSVLAGVAILSPPGTTPNRGVLRFLIFMTLGMPFILIAGWLLTGTGTDIVDPDLILQVTALMGVGFALMMAVFPFHNWVPLVAQESHPYAAAFVLFFIPLAVSLFALSFLSRFTWFSATPAVFTMLRIMGTIMVVVGGVWAAFQVHLGRIMGFAAMVEIGFALLALSLLEPGASPFWRENLQAIYLGTPLVGIYFAQFLPRLISLAVFGLALVVLRSNTGGLDFDSVRGSARSYPIAAISIILALFSIAGLPILAGFPVRLALGSALVNQSLSAALLILVGIAGLLTASLRSIAVLLSSPSDQKWQISENRYQVILLIIGWIFMVVIGLFPQIFLPALVDFSEIFGASG